MRCRDVARRGSSPLFGQKRTFVRAWTKKAGHFGRPTFHKGNVHGIKTICRHKGGLNYGGAEGFEISTPKSTRQFGALQPYVDKLTQLDWHYNKNHSSYSRWIPELYFFNLILSSNCSGSWVQLLPSKLKMESSGLQPPANPLCFASRFLHWTEIWTMFMG